MVNLSFWEKYGRTTKILALTGLIGVEGYLGYNIYNNNINLDKEEVVMQRIKEQSKRIVQSNFALKEEKTKSIAAAKEKENAIAKADSTSRAAVDLKKEKDAAVAHAQKTAREAEIREREYIQRIAAQYALTYPGFDLFIDYVVDGRSFESRPLPWKASMENSGFIAYATNPAKNIEDFLRIKELGEKGLIPRASIEAFFNEKYNKYNADILGQDVRTLYQANASDNIFYGVKLQNDKVIGLDVLSQEKVTYTGSTKEDIKKKMPKINIPSDWRQMKSYQNQKK